MKQIFLKRILSLSISPLLVRRVGKGDNHEAQKKLHRLKHHYEINGSGKPLILLHGGLGATEVVGGIAVPQFSPK
jgi:hypothetical protein